MRRFVFILLLFLPFAAPAQQYNIRTWSVEHGLPQSHVFDIIESRKGNILVATLGGISRFDGVAFSSYTKTTGLSSNSTKTIYQDNKGQIWAGTFDNGLCMLNGNGKLKCYTEADGLPEGGVFAITEDLQHNLIVSTQSGLRILKNGSFKPFAQQAGMPEERFWSVLADKKGNIWATSLSNGVYCYDGKKVTHYTTRQGLRNNITYTVFEDHNGLIWFGHYGGLTRFDGQTFTKFRPEGQNNLNRVWDICSDKKGNLWLALDGGGVLKFDGTDFTRITEENGLASNFVNSILADREGNIWMGTAGGGLQQLTSEQFVHYLPAQGLPHQHVTAITQDLKGNKWVGTFGGGAGKFDGQTFEEFNIYNGLPHNNVNDIKVTPDGIVWLATNGGLTRYNGKEFKTFTESDGLIFNIINYCLPDSGNRLWLGTNEGLSVFNGKTFQNYKLSGPKKNNRITTIFKDSRNRIWLGTISGIFRFSNGQFLPVPELEALDINYINSIAEDKGGTLWFGSYGHGLIAYNPGKTPAAGKVRQFTLKDGLLSEEINSLLIDSRQQLWAGTIKGLSRLQLASLNQKTSKPVFKNYTHQNGFRGIEATENSAIEDQNGDLWFGTVKGLTRFIPENDHHNLYPPQLTLRNIRLFLQDVDWDTTESEINTSSGLPHSLNLNYNQNYLTFYYHATSLTNPEGVRYSFKLKGFDKNWSEPTKMTYATYSNLPPGTYTFQVKAMNSEGIWNKKPVVYTFTISPPIWNNAWFVGLVLSLTAAGAFSLVRIRENNFKKLNMLLEQKVDHRTKLLEEKNREKEVLINEIHHRVKNNLQIITSMLNLQARHIHDPKAKQVVKEVRDRVKAMSTIHQRLYRRDELADIDFATYICGLCRSLFISYGVTDDQVKMECHIPHMKLDIDTAVTLGLIINEIVSNTFKYAFPYSQKGSLVIDLTPLSENLYQLKISDDGIGLPPDFKDKMQSSFGLQLISSLSRKLDGKLDFYSENGTQVNLIFHTFS